MSLDIKSMAFNAIQCPWVPMWRGGGRCLVQDRLTAVRCKHSPEATFLRTLPPMPTSSARGLLTVELRELKAQVERFAEARGERPSSWLRRLVERELSSPAQPASPPDTPEALATEASPTIVKTTLRIEALALARLAQQAAEEGVTRGRWIERRVLNQTAAVAVAPGDVEALSRSTYELAGIGRNLNQIAKSLNTHPGLTTRAERQAISEAVELARSHVDLASGFVASLGPARRPRRIRKASPP